MQALCACHSGRFEGMDCRVQATRSRLLCKAILPMSRCLTLAPNHVELPFSAHADQTRPAACGFRDLLADLLQTQKRLLAICLQAGPWTKQDMQLGMLKACSSAAYNGAGPAHLLALSSSQLLFLRQPGSGSTGNTGTNKLMLTGSSMACGRVAPRGERP